MIDIYRHIDALGGTFDPADLEAKGYDRALGDALAVLEKAGYREGYDPIAAELQVAQEVIGELREALEEQLGECRALDCEMCARHEAVLARCAS